MKKAKIFLIVAIVCVITFLIAHKLWNHRPELYFENYMKHFQNVKTGEEAIDVFGQPLNIERDYDKYEPEKVIYTTLQYDGFAFGMMGEENDRIVMVRITKKGLLSLRMGVDIGDSRTKIESIYYWGTMRFKDGERGYCVKHHWDPTGWQSICIFPEYDENGILVAFDVTDGL